LATYLVIHTPNADDELSIRQPSDMLGLAKTAGTDGASPRWLKTWSPDLHDDRMFSLWEAEDAAAIQLALTKFGFLDHMEVEALRVQEWGPAEILAAEES
jgi:hypothetical protein